MEEQQERVFDKGRASMTLWQCDDIRLGHSVSIFTELSSFKAGRQNDVVRLHFGMKGNYSFFYKQLNQTFHLIGGHHNIMYSNGFDMEVHNRTMELETFGVQYPRELFLRFTENASPSLQRFAEKMMKGESVLLTDDWGAIDPDIQQVIQQVIHCRFTGELKKLFMLSKSIELLVLSTEACDRAAEKKAQYLKSPSDKEKIIAVRDLINERAHHPPNLSEIARTVGLNEYKLKRGFKETFHTTVFGYLTEQRLNLAYRYLQDTQKTAAEIAVELGYATPQHFNNAFKKKFGITPFLVRNNP